MSRHPVGDSPTGGYVYLKCTERFFYSAEYKVDSKLQFGVICIPADRKAVDGDSSPTSQDETVIEILEDPTRRDGKVPAGTCALPNTDLVSSNLLGAYFCPATLNGASVYRYVQGEDATFKQNFGADETSKSAQYCANIPGVGVSCSKYVPCGASFRESDLTGMTESSCGCVGFQYCVNGVGTNTAPA